MPRNAYGLDISDRSAELVSLFQKRGSVAIGGFGRTEIPPGIINRGVILDPDKLVVVLSRFFDAVFGPKRGRLPIGFALPESVVFSKTFPLPANFDRELALKALTIEAADTFPISVNETLHDIWVVHKSQENQDVLFAAVDKHIAEAYQSVLVRAGTQPLFFDSESMALARSLADTVDNQPVLIADIGAKTTMIVLYDLKSVQLSSNIAAGGDNLAAALEVQLNIPLEKAELLKRKAGFDTDAEGGRPFLIMQRPMSEIVEEMTQTVEFYFRKTGRRVNKIILAGGTSLTPLIADYVESGFPGVEIKIGNPLKGVSLEWLSDPDAFKKRSILYASAIGLAERALGSDAGPGINLLPGFKEKRGRASFFQKFSIGSLFSSMASKPKKPHKKKGQPEVEVAEETVAASASTVDSAPVASPEPPPAPPAEEGDILAGLGGAEPPKPPESAAPATPPDPKDSSEMLDFGRGIGDFLGSNYEGAKQQSTEEELAEEEIQMPQTSGNRIKIEHILKRAKGELPEDEETMTSPESRQPRGSKMLVVGMTILVLLLVLAAAGGVYMFTKKTGGISLSWPFGKKAPQTLTNDAAINEPAGTATAPDSVSVSFVASPDQKPAGDKPVVASRVVETDVTANDMFTATGKSVASAGKAKGVITIVNTTSNPYTFVATTRFLSPDGVLFRMDSTTAIPANGSVKTNVTADQPGATGDIGPTTWIIPGLPQSQQDKIYGKSDSAMSGGSGSVPSVTQADLDAAKAKLTEKLRAEGEKNFQAMLATGEKLLPDLITSKELTVEAPAVGTATSKFTMKLTLRFRAMLILESAVLPLLDAKLKSSLGAGDSPANYELGKPQYTVEAYDTAIDQAQIRAEAMVKKL